MRGNSGGYFHLLIKVAEGHVLRGNGLLKDVLEGIMLGKKRRAGPRVKMINDLTGNRSRRGGMGILTPSLPSLLLPPPPLPSPHLSFFLVLFSLASLSFLLLQGEREEREGKNLPPQGEVRGRWRAKGAGAKVEGRGRRK